MKDPEDYRMADEEELIQDDSPEFTEEESPRVYNHSLCRLPWFPSGFV